MLVTSVILCLSVHGVAAAAPDPAAGAAGEPADLSPVPRVVAVTLDREITNTTRDYFFAGLAHAEASHAAALLVLLDTPGGLMEATREMVREILEAEVPVIVYVSPPGARAGSAGVFLTLAAHVAAMAPTTHIGAAHPVGLLGGDVEGVMGKKVENDAAAFAKSLAETRARNMDWAEKAVRESIAVPAAEALQNKVIDLIATDAAALLQSIDGRQVQVGGAPFTLHTANAKVEPFAMSGRQTLVTFLANPDLIYFLLLFGLFLLFVEFKSPGLVVPGVVGVLLLALVLGVQLLPVNFVGVLLIIAAVALFITEIYVSSFGLLAGGGIVCLIVGSYLLFDVPGSSLRVQPVVIWSVALTFAALVLIVGVLLVRAKRQGATSGVEAMVGEEGVVFEDIRPERPGKIHARGAYWTASCSVPAAAGSRVRIKKMDGAKAEVELVPGSGEGAAVSPPTTR
ncbi:MAG: nodulation protein NfeD [Deltaproteobacteria bacterium]|nr:nodulation protein NfeD [Deltaproteobacteria bacterium]